MVLVLVFQAAFGRTASDDSFADLKEDYQSTWCDTFGADLFSNSSFDTWYEFVDRNRTLLQQHEQFWAIDAITGEVGLRLEQELDWGRNQFVVNQLLDFNIWNVEDMFRATNQELALGINEFGKPIPLPCI